ncbi:F510_1955 family glycosylhydrolase [Nonomuraea sp. bgisy101]|uniref:F510_1955 family glycosylhydrolase n=1 Tax=Nonomuraea sp. bgisy101 TaxID=3413784 RepID=UPI003D73F8F2
MSGSHVPLRTAAAAVMILTAAACGQSQPPATASGQDPGIGHVHGVGVDPADGAIYIAGHYGLFRVKDAESAERVAGRVQDHMGFTVVGPRTFLASGHPGDTSTAASPHLGLIRTSDAGRTWTTVSEEGTADFHALQPAGDALYAFDSQSGRLRRSADGGQSWTPGAEEPMIDLAADLTTVYATTPDGLKVSRNGGMDFDRVANAPLLSHVESPAEDTLTGTGVDGRIHTSRDGGTTWQADGKLPGPASAFTAVDAQRLLAATDDGTVLESRDGGRTFSTVFRPANG